MSEMAAKSQICLALMRVGTRMVTGFDQRFADHQITQAQFRVLLAVHQAGGNEGIAPSVLADHLLIERATVSLLAARLVERGLLERQVDPTTRRSHKLRLTPSGGQTLQALGQKATALGEETLSVFNPEEETILLEMLARLEQRLRDMAHQREAAARTIDQEKNA